jgi:hypothetical protein
MSWLPLQPAHGVFLTDEIRRSAALIAGLDPQHMLIEARQGAAVSVGVLSREAHQPSHDLVRITARDEVRLDCSNPSPRFERRRHEVRG